MQPDGTVNRNSGAESTIHGLLSMQVLDAHPDLAALARASASIRTRDGLRIVEAENGKEGLSVIQSQAPDLVLSDWNMPEMTGIDMLCALRAAGNDVRFGFVTSEGSEELRTRAAQQREQPLGRVARGEVEAEHRGRTEQRGTARARRRVVGPGGGERGHDDDDA